VRRGGVGHRDLDLSAFVRRFAPAAMRLMASRT
jgi:hypothetical protein